MLTRKEFMLVMLTGLATTALVVLAQPNKSIMGASAIDWNSIEAKPTKTGFTRKFFEQPTATLELLECHVTTLNPGETSHPPHKHPEEELVVVKEGMVEVLVNGEWKRMGVGSVVFNACNVEHALRNAGDKPATYHVFMWRSATTPKREAVK